MENNMRHVRRALYFLVLPGILLLINLFGDGWFNFKIPALTISKQLLYGAVALGASVIIGFLTFMIAGYHFTASETPQEEAKAQNAGIGTLVGILTLSVLLLCNLYGNGEGGLIAIIALGIIALVFHLLPRLSGVGFGAGHREATAAAATTARPHVAPDAVTTPARRYPLMRIFGLLLALLFLLWILFWAIEHVADWKKQSNQIFVQPIVIENKKTITKEVKIETVTTTTPPAADNQTIVDLREQESPIASAEVFPIDAGGDAQEGDK